MDTTLLLKALIAIAPVIVLLLVFDRLDIFDLVTFREIALLLLAGGAIAIIALGANTQAMDGFPIGFSAYSRYVAPIIEESLKATPIVVLFAINRLGFKLDSAIAGFAVGAGFSVIENGWFLHLLGDANMSAWIVRGFGTAVMHGGATAIFAVISHEFAEHQSEANAASYRFNPLIFVPGLAAAIFTHSAFNHFPNQPIVAMVLTLLFVPMTLFVIFARSELATHRWLKADHDAHRKTLEDIRAGRFLDTSAGQAIAGIVRPLKAVKVDDVVAHVALSTELIVRAEEIMLAGQEGRVVEGEAGEREKFAALDALERRLGPKVLAATRPHSGISRNDVWELGRLRAQVNRRR